MERLFPCKQDAQYSIHLVNVTFRSEKTFIILNGYIEVDKTIRGPLLVEISGEKCDMDDSRCIAFAPPSLGNICGEFTNKNNIFGKKFLPHIVPPLSCPLKQGLYKLRNVTADVKEFAKFPLEGSRVKPHFTLYHNQDGKKKVLACINTALSITMSSTRRG